MFTGPALLTLMFAKYLAILTVGVYGCREVFETKTKIYRIGEKNHEETISEKNL